ncbi:MAG: flagellar basal-body MS-ring/collar protein FliF [Hyphomicrobiaceae bacterium]
MSISESFDRLGPALTSLGLQKLIALAIVGLTVFVAVGVGGMYLSRPAYETLYAGLSTKDIGRIRVALAESGMKFNVDSKGTSILVPYGQAQHARMVLAQKGLPSSSTAGYELFDSLGSMGLTSFMQEVTRKRALEGEIARTLQAMQGVRAARVHIVLPNRRSFRRRQAKTSASVVIRTEGEAGAALAQPIRHLVASAVPGLNAGQVTVLTTDGTMLASGGDAGSTAPHHKIGLEQSVSQVLTEKVRNTLTPFLGIDNFRVSVAAKLNIDRRQTRETKFDPESRVERSVRVLKSSNASNNKQGNEPATVEQNIPLTEDPEGKSGNQSNEKGERREELTNYELNSKTTSTESVGYQVERLTVAVVVNRQRLAAELGAKANGVTMEQRLKEIERIAATAAGVTAARGDDVAISAVDFVDQGELLQPVPDLSITDHLARHTGTFVNAGAVLLALFLVLQFGLRPLTAAILKQPQIAAEAAPTALASEPSAGLINETGSGAGAAAGAQPELLQASTREDNAMRELAKADEPEWQNRLERLLDDEDKAVDVFRQWIHEDANA